MLFGHFGGNFGYFYSYHLVTLFNSQIGSNTNSSNGKKGLRHEWQLPQQPKANLNSAFWTSSSTSTTFIPSRKVFCVFCVCVQLVIEYIPILTSTHKTPFKIFLPFLFASSLVVYRYYPFLYLFWTESPLHKNTITAFCLMCNLNYFSLLSKVTTYGRPLVSPHCSVPTPYIMTAMYLISMFLLPIYRHLCTYYLCTYYLCTYCLCIYLCSHLITL